MDTLASMATDMHMGIMGIDALATDMHMGIMGIDVRMLGADYSSVALTSKAGKNADVSM